MYNTASFVKEKGREAGIYTLKKMLVNHRLLMEEYIRGENNSVLWEG